MIKFTGTRAEFGRFHADYLKAARHDFYTHLDRTTLRKQLHIYQKFYPELVTEIRAAAEAVGRPADFLLYEDLASFVDHQRRRVQHHQHGCTIFAVRENDQVFVGRNYDWLATSRDFFAQYQLAFTSAYRYFAFSDEGVWGRHTGKNTRKMYIEDAVNEYGLYIGLTYAHIDKWNYGLSPTHFIRYIVEHCRTTRQALNAFAKIPCAIPKNFLIADATGDLAVVEHAATRYAVRRPGPQGILIQTNHVVAPELQKFDHTLQDNPHPTSYVRYAEAEYLLRTQLPNFQFTDLWPILRRSRYVYNKETIWSLALELSSQRFNLYFDTAPGQKQQKFGF